MSQSQFSQNWHVFVISLARCPGQSPSTPVSARASCTGLLNRLFAQCWSLCHYHRVVLRSTITLLVFPIASPISGNAGLVKGASTVLWLSPSVRFCCAGILLGRRFLLVSEDPAAQTFVVFVLHLKRLEWRRLKGRKSAGNPRIFDPPAKVGASLTITSDGRLILAGGKPRQPRRQY